MKGTSNEVTTTTRLCRLSPYFREANHTSPWKHRLVYFGLLCNRNVWSHEHGKRMSKERYQNSSQSEINRVRTPSVNVPLAKPFLSIQYNNRWVKEKDLANQCRKHNLPQGLTSKPTLVLPKSHDSQILQKWDTYNYACQMLYIARSW